MQELVQSAKILSDINRLNILRLLLRDKEVCVCEICDTLELSQPLVSRHLKQMKEAEVLASEQKGKWVIYFLHKELNSLMKCFLNELEKMPASLPPLVTCKIK